MTSPNEEKIAEELSEFLLKLSKQKDKTKLSREAGQLISRMTPEGIARAEKRLYQSGLTASEIHRLSAAFVMVGLLEQAGPGLRSRLPDHHILRKVMAEHDMIRCFLADLETLADRISTVKQLNPSSSEMMRLGHIAEHLNSLDEHLDRENDVLFPMLRQYGWESIFTQVQAEHAYIRIAVQDLVKLVIAAGKMPTETFKTRLLSTVHYLCPLLRDHLFHEDRVLFPLAVMMADNDKIWTRLREVCNQIDYCGIHL